MIFIKYIKSSIVGLLRWNFVFFEVVKGIGIWKDIVFFL